MSALLIGLCLVATPQDPTPGVLDPWISLDDELALWEKASEEEIPPAHLSGYIQTTFAHTILHGSGGLAAFGIPTARIALSGTSTDDFSYRLSGDFADASDGSLSDGDDATDDPQFVGGFGTFKIKDAYLRSPIPGPFNLTAGNFKLPILRSSRIDANRMLFPARTHAGTQLAERDQGLMIDGHWDILRGFMSISNGQDGTEEEMMVGTRLEVDVAGKGVAMVEGALGAPSELAITVGASLFEDGSINEDGRIIAVDMALTYDRLAISSEVVDFGDGFGADYGANMTDPFSLRGPLTETRPRAFTISYMAKPDEWELMWRLDYLDEGFGSERNIQTFGLNHYIEGHDLKWQFGVIVDEKDGPDEDFLSLGLFASF